LNRVPINNIISLKELRVFDAHHAISAAINSSFFATLPSTLNTANTHTHSPQRDARTREDTHKERGDRAQVASRPPLTPFACTCSFFQPVFDASHFPPPCSLRPTAASSGAPLPELSIFLSAQAPRLSPSIQILFPDSDKLPHSGSFCCDIFNPDLNTGGI